MKFLLILKYTFLALLFGVFLVGCQNKGYILKSTEGRFIIEFPKKPETDEKEIDRSAKLTEYQFDYNAGNNPNDDNLNYMLTYFDFPADSKALTQPGTIGKILDGTAYGTVVDTLCRFVSMTTISLNGYPGRKLISASLDGETTSTLHIFLVKNRLYMLLVTCLKEKDGNSSMQKFFNSFALL